MKIFVAASYSSQVNYETGEVFPEYQAWLEDNLTRLEKLGHSVFLLYVPTNTKLMMQTRQKLLD